MVGVEITLHVVISVLASCLCVFALMRARGVRGLRQLNRDMLDLQVDYSALAGRLKRMQTSLAGEASVEAKKKVSKATLDFQAAASSLSPPGADQHVMGQ